MRVTQNMLTNFSTRALQQSQGKLFKTQEQLSTGNKINRASDDPQGMRKILDYRSSLSQIAQYKENISAGKERVEMAETTLDAVQDLLTQAKETAMDNATSEFSSRGAAAQNIRGVMEQAMGLANARIGKEYLFAGYLSDAAPFTIDGGYNVTYHGDDNAVYVKTGDTGKVEINTSGSAVFTGASLTDGTNVFDAMRDVAAALESEPMDSTVLDEAVNRLGKGIEQIQVSRQGISMRYSQLKSSEASLGSLDQIITNRLSNTQKVDTVQAAVELKAQQLAYEAALSTVSRMFDLSLMKFLG